MKSCVCAGMEQLSFHSLRLTADIVKVWKENVFIVEGVDLGRINRNLCSYTGTNECMMLLYNSFLQFSPSALVVGYWFNVSSVCLD